MTKIKTFAKQHWPYMLASFFLPFLIMAVIYLTIGIYPGSSRSVLASDAFSQFSNFHASFRNMLLGKQSIFLYVERLLRLKLSGIDLLLLRRDLHSPGLVIPESADARCAVLFDLDQDRQCGLGVLVLCQPNL